MRVGGATGRDGLHRGGARSIVSQLHELSEQETLRLFCEHYQNVLDTPDGDSHANIRSFLLNGWEGIDMASSPLRLKDRLDANPMESDGI
jgi:hypothetical protein